MGASGAGKSSILRLLTGAFKNFEGSVLIDNMPIGNYTLDSIRSQTGILLSQQDIFNGTLWENITMGNKEVSGESVTSMVQKCGLAGYVESLPNGYDTILDPSGKKLTGKIRQDILLLRALLGKRRLLLLEEPLNFLEDEYKKHIASFMLKEESTTVLIATSEGDIRERSCKSYR
jgi:ABC-type bacteriocin/lantibiotic exporter with double-glycine peptidase domain